MNVGHTVVGSRQSFIKCWKNKRAGDIASYGIVCYPKNH